MHGGLELVSQEMCDLCPLPLSFSVSLFLRVLPLFNPFSMSPSYCVSDIMNLMLFLWSVDCTCTGEESKEVYFEGGTSSFLLLFCEDASFPLPHF